jgi:hypothetical protein
VNINVHLKRSALFYDIAVMKITRDNLGRNIMEQNVIRTKCRGTQEYLMIFTQIDCNRIE